MFKKQMKKSVVAAAIAGVLALAGAGSAQALAVSGTWDPAYGASFAGLGWSGEASWEVPQYCLDSVVGTVSTNANLACGISDIFLLSAKVNFYNVSNSSALGSLVWTGAAPQGPFPNVTSMSFGGGLVTGLETGLFNFLHGPAALDPSGGDQNFWALQFTSISGGFVQARLAFKSCEVELEECTGLKWNDSVNYPAVVKGQYFTSAIPEPQTYALMLAGLAAMGFVARRRRQS